MITLSVKQKADCLDDLIDHLSEEQRAYLFDSITQAVKQEIKLVRRMPLVGETVILRKWEDMVEEFGIDEFGHPKTEYLSYSKFIYDMWSGMKLCVTGVGNDSFGVREGTLFFTPDMIEPLPEL